MNEWHKMIQQTAEAIDEAILEGRDEHLSLGYLAGRLGYSPYHTTRMFRELSGLSFRDYLRLRRLSFALLAVRDTERSFLDIAVAHGFSSHEAFTRAFKLAYGVTPAGYRANPVPVVLRTMLTPFDRYTLGLWTGAGKTGGIGMIQADNPVKIYYVRIPAHRFLHIKNYESDGYLDFWNKQEKVPGQDCDTICGLLDSIRGKLDGDDSVIGRYSGQIMGYPIEADGRRPEAYGVRLSEGYTGPVPQQMQIMDVPEGEYIVFEHSPFDFESECEAAYGRVNQAMEQFDYSLWEYVPDNTPGRVSYYYNDPDRYLKRVMPVCRK